MKHTFLTCLSALFCLSSLHGATALLEETPAPGIIARSSVYAFVGNNIHKTDLMRNAVVTHPILHVNTTVSSSLPKNDLLFSKHLIFPKGFYTFHGIRYDLTREGLHRILDVANHDSLQLIIYENDVPTLLSSFAWSVKHGNRDDRKPFKSLVKLQRQGNLSMTCGPVSNYVHTHLRRVGIRSRLIHFNRGRNFNSYDNGHILLEVKIDGKWVLADIDNNMLFLDPKRGFLNAYDIATQQDAIKHRITLATDGPDTMHFTDRSGKTNYAFFMEDLDLDAWYAQIMQILFIYDGKGGLPLCRPDADWEEIKAHYHYKTCLDPKRFYKHYYGETE